MRGEIRQVVTENLGFQLREKSKFLSNIISFGLSENVLFGQRSKGLVCLLVYNFQNIRLNFYRGNKTYIDGKL